MTPESRKRKIRWLIPAVLFTLAGLALGYYLIKRVFDPLENVCVEVLPQNKRVGMKFSRTREGQIEMDLLGERGVQSGATPQQIDAFVRCIEATKGEEVVIKNGVRLPLEPVGQVANRWAREPGLHLALMPGSNNKALNNLAIGPAVGPKENVIRAWCSLQQAGPCVSCEPDQPTADTVEVLIRLRDHAPVEVKRFPGSWPVPQPGLPSEPWQLVNEKGERFYYECKQP